MTIDSVSRTLAVEMPPIPALVAAGLTAGHLSHHQGLAGAIDYIPDPDDPQKFDQCQRGGLSTSADPM